ncbi:MAG: glycoside hydrolase family 92 protein [Cytophagales bacterium]|nr:MAG: glycoside hydrolase family 92 protein [Cytophagales bacterium]
MNADKLIRFVLFFLCLRIGLGFGYCQDTSLVRFINPLIGTNSSKELSHGNTLPLVARPFGMTYWTPQTTTDKSSGWVYTYSSTNITGFRATRIPSPWMGDYGTFSVMPQLGELELTEQARAASYSHAKELATPYSYQVTFEKNNITTEYTATERCAYFKFKFPKSKNAHVLIDAFTGGSVVKVIPEENKVIGTCRNNTGSVPANFAGYFVAVFSQSFTKSGTWIKDTINGDELEADAEHVGAYLRFSTDTTKPVFMKIATSFISIEQAELNLQNEIGDKTFEATKEASKKVWELEMQKIKVEGASNQQKTVFYSCFYRTILFPRMLYEFGEDGKSRYYSAFDGKIHEGVMYADNGLWDTFRGVFPFFTLLYPDRHQEFCQALVNAYKEGGWLPRWLNPGYKEVMIGAHAASLFVDAYSKGLTKFDLHTAYQAMIKDANQQRPDKFMGRDGLQYYNQLGYVPTLIGESVSKTLEYAYDDYCIYKFAGLLGKYQDTALYKERAYNYINTFDAHTNLMRPRNIDGSWLEHFNKYSWGGHYTEGNAWHWNWSVFHDPQGLINLMGGKDIFVNKMDSIFILPPHFDFHHYGYQIHEITEMLNAKMGQYAHGNQPMQHFIYLYNYANQAWKTQFWARTIMNKLYTSDPNGYCGDEDNGQTSAWYILSALGFYQVCPGEAEYTIGSPMFGKTTVKLPNGKTMSIEANNNLAKNYYIQSAKLNNANHTKSYITYDQIMQGGLLKFEMSSLPNKTWATNENEKPSSLTKYKACAIPYTEYHGGYFMNHINVPLHTRTIGGEIRYTTDASEPNINSSLYSHPLYFTKSTRLKAKVFKQGYLPSPTLDLFFNNKILKSDSLITPVNSGLKYKFYEGEFDGIPDFETLKPKEEDTVSQISVAKNKDRDNFGLVMEGFIKIPEDAIYTFYMGNIDEAAKLYIDDELFIEAYYHHGKHEHRHKAALQAGYHRIKLEYIETTGVEKLNLQIKSHQIGKHHASHHEKHSIPATWLYH